jgi:TolB-like protein/tetratricopeptide (TPR) repeat protein
MIYSFEGYVLDSDQRELRWGAVQRSLQPQVFDLLEYLIRNRDRIVSKDDLLNAIWRGRVVSDTSLSTRINQARAAIGDTGSAQRLIRTVTKKGFRFVAEVREENSTCPARVSAGARERNHDSRAELPVIAVVPFTNMSGTDETETVADSLTEDLITALASSRWCFVISRNSSFAYKDQNTDAREVAQKHDVRYVLEGSIRLIEYSIRISVRLIDATTNRHVWADRFDSDPGHLFPAHEDIVGRIIRGLSLSVSDAEVRRTLRAAPVDDTTLGWGFLNRPINRLNTTAAVEALERAVKADNFSVRTLVGLSHAYARSAINIWSTNAQKEVELAENMLTRALAIDPDRAEGHYARGLIRRVQDQPELSIIELEVATNLCPSLAPAYAQIGQSYMRLGHAKRVFAFAEKSLRMSPHDSHRAIWLFMTGSAHLYLSQYDEALKVLQHASLADPDYNMTYALLAAAHALRGNRIGAQRALRELRRVTPDYTISTYRAFARGENRMYEGQVLRTCDGLRKAGLPER